MSLKNKYDAPKVVLHHVENILEGLRESFFFEDYDIGEEYATKSLIKIVTEKYVENPTLELDFFWSEEEFGTILKTIVTGSIMYQLKEQGIMGSYEDDDTEEQFYLTEKGKEITKNLK
tara:strand:- start:11522 stop:11875 length:354 start_codon:yes stop_codon:yes gene_type:complete